jgi:hypothetical protein
VSALSRCSDKRPNNSSPPCRHKAVRRF